MEITIKNFEFKNQFEKVEILGKLQKLFKNAKIEIFEPEQKLSENEGNCNKPDVSKQRELLLSWKNFESDRLWLQDMTDNEQIDLFLKQ